MTGQTRSMILPDELHALRLIERRTTRLLVYSRRKLQARFDGRGKDCLDVIARALTEFLEVVPPWLLMPRHGHEYRLDVVCISIRCIHRIYHSCTIFPSNYIRSF
jgi:hypothetical protein